MSSHLHTIKGSKV